MGTLLQLKRVLNFREQTKLDMDKTTDEDDIRDDIKRD